MERYKINLQIDDIYPKHIEGRCRRCQTKLTGKQTKWCSTSCSNFAFDDLMFAKGSSKHLRERVFTRDNGVCASCGVDAEKIQRISDHCYRALYHDFADDACPFDFRQSMSIDEKYESMRNWEGFKNQYMKDARRLLKDTPLNFGGSCWQADHILEVFHGGKHEMDNLQTLCNLCHKNKTKNMSRKIQNKSQSSLFA